MSAKKATRKSTVAMALRKKSPASGKRATITTKAGFESCLVLCPVDARPDGQIDFVVALRVAPAAGKVSFVPRGKETIVIDATGTPDSTALTKFVRRTWQKKGGPPTVVD